MLIAVLTCERNAERVAAVRETWASVPVEGVDVRFFRGGGPSSSPDEIVLDVDDGYASLPAKVKALFTWASANGYQHTWKVDDDIYVVPQLLLRVPKGDLHHHFEYVGRFRSCSGGYPAEYASGFCYRLSNRAASFIAQSKVGYDWAEDRWVGNRMALYRMHGFQIGNFLAPLSPPLDPYTIIRTNARHAAAFCEFTVAQMREMHRLHSQIVLPQLPVDLPVPGTPTRLMRVTEYDLSHPPTDKPDWSKQHAL